ncbi:Ylh47p [Lachancea thermotolerans CBS 6340]|uniref:KLTH0F14080p n=1 Tax=Lachancea thermotolerans (strain ATCC 56472 / CBS 6340 / NRRL Y-8284) TaxID=559295 RepID=C5DJ74_LACTC|nr:KLTH0F14080p [Lachancea thermotolerans CBS 6340]CAR24363.1 KLTH0F14080p [Lachancea thermotolerans CBS 6340]
MFIVKYRPPVISRVGRRTAVLKLGITPRTYTSQVPNPSKKPTELAKVDQDAVKLSLWDKVKHEVHHYWDGTKLLGLEMKISFRLLMKTAAGHQLSRRETLQLKRTTQDVVRLVPFSAFVLVPFAELLLPVALKLFPNMLPSTYESKKDKLSKLTSLRQTRGLVSSIIKEQNSHFKPNDINDEQKLVFNSFYKHVRATGEPESRQQLIHVARLFKDDTVLDNVTRPYLVALAKYINLQPFGTDVMLRYRIRFKMLELKKDDFAIFYEGVQSLDSAELRTACASRGIRNLNVEDSVLRDNLSIWLNMRLKDKIPSTLLIMATAYTYGDVSSKKTLYDALCDVLSGIPDELYHEVKVNVVEEENATSKSRMAQIKEQEEIMKEEEQQEKDALVRVRDELNLDDVDKQAQLQDKRRD